MAPTWASDRANYIEPLLRAVDGGQLGRCQMACVFYATRSPFSLAITERSHWSDSTADVRAWLDSLPLAGGGGCGDAALAEALADAIFLLQQAATHFPAPDSGGGGGGGGTDGGTPGSGGGNGSSGRDGPGTGGVSQQLVVVARSDPHRLAIPWPVPDDAGTKALLPGRASYMDLLVTGLQRRGIGLSIVTGAMQPHKWLVLAALKVAEGPAAGESAPGAIGAKQQELYKAMAAGFGQDSTVLVSQQWPAALRLLQGLAAERRAAAKAAGPAAPTAGSRASTPGEHSVAAATPPGGGATTLSGSTGQLLPQGLPGSMDLPPLALSALQAVGGAPPMQPGGPSPAGIGNAASPAYWAPSPGHSAAPATAPQGQPQPSMSVQQQQQAPPAQPQQPLLNGHLGGIQQPPQQAQHLQPPPPQHQQPYPQAPSPAGSVASTTGQPPLPPPQQQQQPRPALTPEQQRHLAHLRSLPPELQAAEMARLKAKRQQQLAAAGAPPLSGALMPPIPSATPQQPIQQQQLPPPQQQQYAQHQRPPPQLPPQLQPPRPAALPPAPAPTPQGGGPAAVVWEGDLVLSARAAKTKADASLARVRVIAQQSTWSLGEASDWPPVLSIDKITQRAALIQHLPLNKAPRCSLAFAQAFSKQQAGHATLLELAQRELGGIVTLPGRGLVILLGLQQPQAPPQGGPPLPPLHISGYVVKMDQMQQG